MKSTYPGYKYSKTSNISHTLVDIKIVDHSDVVGASPVWRCSNYIFVINLAPGFNRLGEDNHKTRWATFKFWDLVWLIVEVLWWVLTSHKAKALTLTWFKNFLLFPEYDVTFSPNKTAEIWHLPHPPSTFWVPSQYKDSLSMHRDIHYYDKQSGDCLIFIMVILVLVRGLYIETGPWGVVQYKDAILPVKEIPLWR